MNKKGLSTIVATLLIILLVLVAVGIVWGVVRNIITEGAEEVSLGKLTLSLEISNVKVTDTGVDVQVKRNPGAGEMSGLKFIISDGVDTVVFDEEVTLQELASKTFTLDYTGLVKEISIAPVFTLESGKESVGNIVDVEKLSSKQIIENLGGVGWWKFEGSGQDEFGDNHGSVTGGEWVDGKFGQAFDNFDGSNTNYITISGAGSLKDVTDDGNSFSLGCWFSPNGLPQQTYSGYIFFRKGIHLGFYHSKSAGTLVAVLWHSTSLSSDSFSSPNVGTWYHLVMSVDESSNEMKFFVDGSQVGNTKTITSALREYGTATWQILGYLSGSYVANGKIDECQIFNKALSDDQVKALYELDLS